MSKTMSSAVLADKLSKTKDWKDLAIENRTKGKKREGEK